MWNRTLLCLAFCAAMALTCAAANTADQPNDRVGPAPANGKIAVQFKGGLLLGTKLKSGADPDSRPQDDDAWELSSAVVMAGGTHVQLEWRHSDDIRDELLWWRLPRHGDIRQVQAEVTGTMTFKPSKEIEGCMTDTKGFTAETPVPIVTVKSLHVQLVGADGEPTGPQFGRKRVTAD